MRSNQTSWASGALWRALSGIQMGVLGGLVMLGWFLLASALRGHPTWTVPNLLGLLIRDEGVLRRGFSQDALTGLALLISTGGVTGALFGVAAGGAGRRRRMLLMGIAAGLAIFQVSSVLVFRRLGAVAWIYSSRESFLVGHLLFGLVLGCYPLQRPQGSLGASVSEQADPPPDGPGVG